MSIRDLLNAKAIELAAADGVSAAIVHLHAAAAQLGAEIRRELDALVAEFRPAGSAHQGAGDVAAASGDAAGETEAADAPAAEAASAPAAAPDASVEPSESAS
jgi:hypothetical protein